MNNLENIVDAIGRGKLASALGVGPQAISNAVSAGVAPSSWFDVVESLAKGKKIAVARDLFNFKKSVADFEPLA